MLLRKVSILSIQTLIQEVNFHFAFQPNLNLFLYPRTQITLPSYIVIQLQKNYKQNMLKKYLN